MAYSDCMVELSRTSPQLLTAVRKAVTPDCEGLSPWDEAGFRPPEPHSPLTSYLRKSTAKAFSELCKAASPLHILSDGKDVFAGWGHESMSELIAYVGSELQSGQLDRSAKDFVLTVLRHDDKYTPRRWATHNPPSWIWDSGLRLSTLDLSAFMRIVWTTRRCGWM